MVKLVKTDYDDITYRVIGAAMEVHNHLGPGLKEVHYQKAMEQALRSQNLNFEAQKQIGVYFDRSLVGLLFMDIFVEDQVVVELKALSHLTTKNEFAQVITYLKASCGKIGLLVNFGRKYLEYRRVFPPKAVTKFDANDWRFVYKFKRPGLEFPSDKKAQTITCLFR